MSTGLPEKIGKYRIERELGRGATGTVYCAHDPFRDRPVAIKVPHPELLKDPENGDRFRRLLLNEAALVGKLNHPHIVQVLDAETDGDQHYLVMELVPGDTLEIHSTPDRLLPVAQVVEILFKCCGALDYAHRHGLIHRDLKPANIMMAGDSQIKITDFGAAFAQNAEQTQVIGMIGSPAYMSPEQVQEKTLTFHSDMYSLGVVFFRLLTGRLPFEADTHMALIYKITLEDPPALRSLRADIPESLEPIVRRCLQKAREDRYPSWMALATELAQTFQHLPMPADSISDTEKFEALRQLSFFRDFGDSQLWEVLRLSSWKRVQAGAVLIHEDRHGRSFYIVAQGRLKVYKQKVLLSQLEAGSCVGEMSYLNPDNPVRTATVVAAEDGLILKVHAEALSAASDEVRACFDRQFIRLLVERLVQTNHLLANANL